MKEWQEVSLGSVSNIISQKTAITNATLDNYISTDNMLPYFGGIRKAEKLPNLSTINCFSAGDILFSNIRTYFKKVWYSTFDGTVSADVLVFRTISSSVMDNMFLYLLLCSPEFTEFTVLTSKGAKMPRGDKEAIKSYKFMLPPLPEQKAIAGVLSSLDDKIDLLHRQNQTLEAMAETLFRQWFIEEAEDDWEHFQVKDFVQHIKISVKPQEKQQVLFNHFSIPSFDNDKTPQVEYGKAIQSNKYKVFENTILVSKLNPMTPRVWAIINLHSSNSICSTEFQVIQPLDQKLLGFFFYLLKSNRVVTELGMAASGTSGSHQRITALDILHISFSVPNMARINSFSQLVRGNLLKIDKNRESIKALERFRDLLLPKLMSGEVRVEF